MYFVIVRHAAIPAGRPSPYRRRSAAPRRPSPRPDQTRDCAGNPAVRLHPPHGPESSQHQHAHLRSQIARAHHRSALHRPTTGECTCAPAASRRARRASTTRSFEHDACGVAFVATMTGVPSHDIVGQGAHRAAQPRAPRRRRRRARLRRRRRHPDPGPGRASSARSSTSSSPAGRVRRRHRVPPRRRRAGRQDPAPASRRSPPRRASTVLGWRDVPTDPSSLGATAPGLHAALRPALRRRLGQPRARDGARAAAPSCCASAPSARPTSTSRRCRPHPRLQGHAHHRPARPVFPDLVDERFAERDRPGALAVLHQHLPVLAAGAPVPVHRPQRRDQHRQGQPQLDARPRGAARSPT